MKKVVPPEFLDKETVYYINPTGQVRRRRPAGRLRAHRPQDHRRHLRRLRPARRRRVQRQGPEQGRPQRRLHRALRREERRRGRSSRARCEVQVAYAIGVADPVSVLVDTFGTGVVPDEKIAALVRELFDFKPASHHPDARAEAADLPAHGGVRALRARAGRTVLHVGAHRPGRRPAQRGRARQAIVGEVSGSGSLGQGLVHQLHADRALRRRPTATRLMLPARTSPTTNTPGTLVSSR